MFTTVLEMETRFLLRPDAVFLESSQEAKVPNAETK